MTRDEIVQIAKEAGWPDWQLQLAGDTDDFHRLAVFAELIAAAERERCAKVCDDMEREYWYSAEDQNNFTPVDCSERIRAIR